MPQIQQIAISFSWGAMLASSENHLIPQETVAQWARRRDVTDVHSLASKCRQRHRNIASHAQIHALQIRGVLIVFLLPGIELLGVEKRQTFRKAVSRIGFAAAVRLPGIIPMCVSL